MAGEAETAVETPQNNVTVDEPVKTDKEVIVEEEKAAEKKDEKKDEEKEEEKEKKAVKPKKEAAPPKLAVHKQDFEQDVIYLYQFNRSPVIPSVSPFCLKVESWLKLQGIKYENVDHKCKFRSKKGQMLPFIEMNGEESSDSDLIIASLAKKFEKDINAALTPDQKNVQHAMIAMVENHLHWALVHWRSKNHENMLKGYKMNLQTAIGSRLPISVLNFYFKYSYCRKGLKKVKAQGLGVHSAEDIEQFGKNDLTVLSELLGDKEFFFGDEPAMLDLVVFSHVAQIVMVDKEQPCTLRDFLENDCKNLVGLVNRMKDRCWGDHWDVATGEEMDMNPHIPKPDPPAPEPEKEEEKKETKEEEKKEEEKETADEKKEDKEKVEEKEKDENKESEEKK